MMSSSAHIIGCGYLGRRVAAHWIEQGKRVSALTRNNARELRSLGIEPIVGDILEPDSLRATPQVETILYAVGMDRKSGRSFREVYLDGLNNVLDTVPAPARFIYIGSTSVYGQTDGEIVDEASPTEPVEVNGKVVLEAERMLRSRIPDAIILQFAGIYGPGRIIRRAAIEKGEPLIGDAEKWLNLIHVEDGAQAVLAADERAKTGESYLIADDRPVRRREFFEFVAAILGAPPARFVPASPGNQVPHEAANRRISNRKMREELAVELRFPEFQSGLRASVETSS